jgi:sulfate/thiosulfate transport system ATP-binding protein
VLNHGRVEQVGTPDELQGNPASRFVMTFLGDAAQIAARVEDGFAVIGERRTRIAVPAANGAVTLCCRPWDIRLVALADADAVGTIHAVRRLGGSRRVEIHLAQGSRVEVEAPVKWSSRAGESVGLAIDRACVFPPRS